MNTRILMIVAALAVGVALFAGCNSCCEPNPCDPCAPNPCDEPNPCDPCDPCAAGNAGAAAPAAAPAGAGAGCGAGGKSCG
ncbi:MAG: hypothetical protein P1V36_15485 [Planctomycetota bacterium]|nr:hypothetical protein [Planctomycetota bacterium]